MLIDGFSFLDSSSAVSMSLYLPLQTGYGIGLNIIPSSVHRVVLELLTA